MERCVLFIGLDGATWKLLKPWVDRGELPTIKKLMNDGCWGKLRSTIPALTAPAWTTIASGKNPGKTGVFDFIDRHGNLITSKDIKCERIWNILSKHKYKCCVINYPLTYPPEKINGVIVSDFLSPEERKDVVYPKRFKRLLKEVGYRVSLPWEKLDINAENNKLAMLKKRENLLDEIWNVTEKRFALAFGLAKMKWDFFVLVIKESDDISHFFWDKKNTLLAYFKMLDKNIGKLISELDEKNKNQTIIIASDHGFGESQKIGFNLYPILKKIGAIKETLHTSLVNLIVSNPLGLFGAGIASRIWALRKLINESYVKGGGRLWGVYLENRETAERLKKLLENYRNPRTNEKIFKVVKLREEEYRGKYLEEAPEVIYVAHPRYKPLLLPIAKLFVDSYSILPGDHFSYPEGIVIISKCGKKSKRLKMRAEDITPTILKMFGIDEKFNFDGKPQI